MNEYTVDFSQATPINFSPQSISEEIAQNIRMIVTTIQGTAPLARQVGMMADDLDDPIQIVKARLSGSIISVILEQEPRALITEVLFTETAEESAVWGRLVPVIRFRLNDEVNP